ncbi:MAG: glycosyltransferase [Proteobacteria bacterium]|nr:glycosyltransferase [Pseudomonadota bacterium]
MWMILFLFILMTLLLGWVMFGYFLCLGALGRLNRRKEPVLSDYTPVISVIVPCYNEEEHIIEKLEDILNLDYPRNYLDVVFADGGSNDGTLKLLDENIKDYDHIRVVKCGQKGKINQLNYVLPKVRGDIVVNTDTDARLSPDLLKWIAAEFAVDTNVWVVGAYSRPQNSILIERYYWSAQNKGRLMESNAGTSSIVIAQCYAFKRELIKQFPEDVVADDIYIAFLANTLGYRTVYSRRAKAMEIRAPESYREFITHKFRKNNAFLRESLRFLYLLPNMTSFCKMMFLTRTTQLLFLPWIFLLWIMLGMTALVYCCFSITAFGIVLLSLLFIVTSCVFSHVDLPDGHHQYSLRTVVTGFTVTLIIMLWAGISYPFVRQSSSYRRLASSEKLCKKLNEGIVWKD